MGMSEMVLLPNDQIMIAGEFDRVNGVPADSVARLQQDGTVDPTFVSATQGGEWYRLAPLADGRILIWGDFTYRGAGSHQSSLARLNVDGTWDTRFEPAVMGSPHAVAVQPDGRILVDGYFRDALGLQRYGVVRLHQDGSRDYTFNPGAGLAGGSFGASVNAMLILPGYQYLSNRWFVLLGGYFSGYDGVPVQALVRLDNPPIPSDLLLRALGWTAHEGARLRLIGSMGARVRIEFSADLRQWEPLTELSDTVGLIEFTDPVAPGIAHRFYRAQTIPPPLRRLGTR